MPPLPVIVRHTCHRWRMTSPGDKVLVAVSGGADSVALLEALRELASELGLTLAVAHLDHGIRGEAAAADAAFVSQLGREAGLQVHHGSVDAPAISRDSGRSLEDAAREARYSFLRATAACHGYNKIAVGHTLDDQAETVLLAMIRGSGAAGLGAMRPVSGDLIRPLIEARRQDVLAYLAGLGRAYRTDETNKDPAYVRNRVRHMLLPLLAEQFNPAIAATLARQAELLRADEELLAGLAAGLLRRIARSGAGAVSLDLQALRRVPRALQRRIVRAAAGGLYEGAVPPLSFANVEDILDLLSGSTGAAVDLPGGRVARRGYREIILSGQGRPAARTARWTGGGLRVTVPARPRPLHKTGVTLCVPGSVDLPEPGWHITFALRDAAPGELERRWVWSAEDAGGGWRFRAALDWDRLAAPLSLRSRAAGDRFRPYGGPGERKLKDFLIDAKVPRADRDSLPLLVDATGAIAAVLPLRAAAWAGVSETTGRLLVIEGTLRGCAFLADKSKS